METVSLRKKDEIRNLKLELPIFLELSYFLYGFKIGQQIVVSILITFYWL